MTPPTASLAPLLTLALLLMSCATTPDKGASNKLTPAPERGEVGGLCGPPSDEDIKACAAPQYSVLGTGREDAVEWGPAGGFANNFGFDRLQCGDGSIPSTYRAGNVGVTTRPSASPAAREEPMDVVDRWVARCDGTGEQIEIYHNLYRCGPRCPPAGMRWEQEAESALGLRAVELKRSGKKDEARALLDDGLKRFPSSERLVLTTINVFSEEDEIHARSLLEAHCGAGNRHACRGLGLLVMNTSEGAAKLRRACEMGHKAACDDAVFSEFLTGTLAEGKVEASIEQLDAACSERYPRACIYLAVMFKRAEASSDRWLPLLDRGCKQHDTLACQMLDDAAKEAKSDDGKIR